jgi:hypothetical protein
MNTMHATVDPTQHRWRWQLIDDLELMSFWVHRMFMVIDRRHAIEECLCMNFNVMSLTVGLEFEFFLSTVIQRHLHVNR